MHYHLEIVLPENTTDIEAAIKSVMAPFDENQDEDSEHSTKNSFWDFYVIGGRWAGSKLMDKYDPALLAQFRQWMQDEHITVSGLQCGKQELSPASQIPKVDAKWNEMFPSDTFQKCPMFNHSNDQYGKEGKGTISGDICKLSDAQNTSCERIIFAGPSYGSGNWDGELEAKFMLSDDFWNGVNYIKSTWNGKVSTAYEMFKKNVEGYKEEYKNKIYPTDNSILVTVDYHS